MLPEKLQPEDCKPEAPFEPMTRNVTHLFKLKMKGEAELKFDKWGWLGGYGGSKTLARNEGFLFVPHKELGSESKIIKFTVFESKDAKKTKGAVSQEWNSMCPDPWAIDLLVVVPIENGVLITSRSDEENEISRGFRITVLEASGRERVLDPELKIKKKDSGIH